METIRTIDAIDGFQIEGQYGGFDGYIVTTDKQVIKVGVDNSQSCCESWGYLTSEDNPHDFIGATLLDVTLTDDALKTEKLPSVYDGGLMFVNLTTDRGVLQLVVYNEHNGYYSHRAIVQSTQLTHDTYI